MDQTLRCNSLACRKSLSSQGQAVSTSCSHIFCYECAVVLFKGRQICPACETPLDTPDDCVVTNLDPSNAYKSSILAGLTPAVIMDICTRAINFYHYQATQEAAYQQVMNNKSLEAIERYALENEALERNAEAEMNLMRQKVKGLQDELNNEKNKSHEMRQAMQASRRDYEKLRSQLESARRQAIGHDNINNKASRLTAMGDSSRPMASSAPRPFHAGRSVNSPTPFLKHNNEQQDNLWQNQMKQQGNQMKGNGDDFHIDQSKSNFVRRSMTPITHPRAEVLRVSESNQYRRLPSRNISTPIRAMPPPGYRTPRERQGSSNVAFRQ